MFRNRDSADRGVSFVVAVSALVGCSALASADTLRVCHPDAEGPLSDWSPVTCACPDGDDDRATCCDFFDIQSAIGSATNGDVICIEAGEYVITSPLTTDGKAITIRGAVHPDGSPATVLDGQGRTQLILCISGEGPGTVFENLEIRNGSASGSTSQGQGGGMYCSGTSPTVKNCRFVQNTSSGGGTGARGGGAVHCFEASPVLESCVFRDNSVADSQSGGALFNRRGAPILESCTFESNRASNGEGGAVYNVGNEINPVFRNCMFLENESGRGAGFYAQSESSNFCSRFIYPSLENCTFRNNKASVDGGGSWSGAAIISYTGCVFDGNTAGGSGGGSFANKDSDVTYVDCDFTDNEASDSGGGAGHNWQQEGCTSEGFEFAISLTRCRFTGNSAGQRGGGLYNTIITLLELEDCEFTSNSAAREGGGVYSSGTNSEIRGCQFAENSANNGSGGGAFCSGQSTLVESCAFESNLVTIPSESGVFGNFGGGGLYLEGEATVSCSSFSGNVVDTTLSQNAKGFGGGVFTSEQGSGAKAFFGCDFSCNSASDRGGGMFCANQGSIIRCNVTGCTAGFGGGIAFDPSPFGGGAYTLSESRICGNTATQTDGSSTLDANCIEDSCSDCAPLDDPCVESDCPGDLNADGFVDGADISILLSAWNTTKPLADITGDGFVNGADLSTLLGDWGACSTRWGCSSGEEVCSCQ